MPKTAAESYTPSLVSQPLAGCRRGAVITPSDVADLANVAKVIRPGGAGTVAFVAADDADAAVLTVTLAANESFSDYQIRRIMSAGTTATNILAGWG